MLAPGPYSSDPGTRAFNFDELLTTYFFYGFSCYIRSGIEFESYRSACQWSGYSNTWSRWASPSWIVHFLYDFSYYICNYDFSAGPAFAWRTQLFQLFLELWACSVWEEFQKELEKLDSSSESLTSSAEPAFAWRIQLFQFFQTFSRLRARGQ